MTTLQGHSDNTRYRGTTDDHHHVAVRVHAAPRHDIGSNHDAIGPVHVKDPVPAG